MGRALRLALLGVPVGGGGAAEIVVTEFTQSVDSTNLVTNGDMETGDPPTGYTAGGVALDGVADERTGGTGAQSLAITRNAATLVPYARQARTLTALQWYLLDLWVKNVDAIVAYGRFGTGSLSYNTPDSPYQSATDWAHHEDIVCATSTVCDIRLYISTTAIGQSGRFDDVRLRAVTPHPQQTLPSADMELEIDLTLPETPYSGQRILMPYRINGSLAEGFNCWMAALYRNTLNTNWNFCLWSVVDGTYTKRAELLEIGVPEKIKCVAYGTQHQCYMYAAEAWTPLHAVVDVDYLTTATGVTVLYSEAMAPTSLRARAASPFDLGLSGTGLAFIDGDSKTDPTASYGFWDFMFEYLAERETGANWGYYNVADAGDTLAEGLAALPASLAALGDTPVPDCALINFGANDVQSLPAEATWKQNLRDYVETIHAKWSTTPIYIMRPWRQGYDAESLTISGWIDDVVAEYAYAYAGPNENVFLKGDDDGAGRMFPPYPNAHPNGWGARLSAQEWVTIVTS